MKKTITERFDSSSPEETSRIAARLTGGLPPGSTVALIGPLGSGKTVFVKGMAAGLGLPARAATSPTFTIINEYGGDPPLVHVDLYRLRDRSEIADLGLEEYIDGPGIVAIEWAEKAGDLLPGKKVTVRFRHLGARRRRITIER
jgi:tRNA threonylcarbamoyladenosine biosynthesis protein TsaE